MAQPPPLELVTVFVGSHARVAVLEALLADSGIPCFVPDRITKTMDPFITGVAPLDLRLQVPTPQVSAAMELIGREFPAAAPPSSGKSVRGWTWVQLLLVLIPAIVGILTI
jgi:hypothetical protein